MNVYAKSAAIAILAVGGTHGALWSAAYIVHSMGGGMNDYLKVVSAIFLTIAVFIGCITYFKHKSKWEPKPHPNSYAKTPHHNP